MNKYIDKEITNEAGTVANAWRGKELVVNLDTGKAHVREAGFTSAQLMVDGKPEAVPPLMWQEPNIWALNCAEAVFTEIATRMVSMETAPSGLPNPFYGGSLKDAPEPTPIED